MNDVNSGNGETPIEAVDPNAEAAERAEVRRRTEAELSTLGEEVETIAESEGNTLEASEFQVRMAAINAQLLIPAERSEYDLDTYKQDLNSIGNLLPTNLQNADLLAVMEATGFLGAELTAETNPRELWLARIEDLTDEDLETARQAIETAAAAEADRRSRLETLEGSTLSLTAVQLDLLRRDPTIDVQNLLGRSSDMAEFEANLVNALYENHVEKWFTDNLAIYREVNEIEADNSRVTQAAQDLGVDSEDNIAQRTISGAMSMGGDLMGAIGSIGGGDALDSRGFRYIHQDPILGGIFQSEEQQMWFMDELAYRATGERPEGHPGDFESTARNHLAGYVSESFSGVALAEIQHDFAPLEIDMDDPEFVEFMHLKMQTVGLGWQDSRWETEYESYITTEGGFASLDFNDWLERRRATDAEVPGGIESLWRNVLGWIRGIMPDFMGGGEDDESRAKVYQDRLNELRAGGDEDSENPGRSSRSRERREAPAVREYYEVSELTEGERTNALTSRFVNENVRIPRSLVMTSNGERQINDAVYSLVRNDNISWGDFAISQDDLDNLSRGFGGALFSGSHRRPAFTQDQNGKLNVLRANDGAMTGYAQFDGLPEFFTWLDDQYREWPADRTEGLADDIESGESIRSDRSLGAGYRELNELTDNDRNNQFRSRLRSGVEIPNALLYRDNGKIKIKSFVYLLVHEHRDDLWRDYEMSQLDLNNLARAYGDILDVQGGGITNGLFEDSFRNTDNGLTVDMAMNGQNTSDLHFDSVEGFFVYLDRQYAHRYSEPEASSEEEPASSDAEPENTTTS